MLINFRRTYHSISTDHINSNFSFSIMTDSSNQFSEKSLFTKLDCSNFYHWVPMTDDLSVLFLAIFPDLEFPLTNTSLKV